MSLAKSYDRWSAQYDTNQNKTRDVEALSLRETLGGHTYENCLEIGCGTGKNTQWLVTICDRLLAVDVSEEMLNVAKKKLVDTQVQFLKADVNGDWTFAGGPFDLVVCSLVLEHIENLDRIFKLMAERLNAGGTLYVGELHPFKQYLGSKAKFETEAGVQEVTCFNHHISDFTKAANKYGLKLEGLNEYFDDRNEPSIPRILTLRFVKSPAR